MAQSIAIVLNDASASQYLKDRLASELEPICDADPVVLADYVIALLKNDKPRDEMRELCVSQLEDFLSEYTVSFVDNLLNMMTTLDFLPNEVRQQYTTGSQYSSTAMENNNNNNNNNNVQDRDRGRDRMHRDNYSRTRNRNDTDEIVGNNEADKGYRRDRRYGSPNRDRNWTRSPSRRRSASPSARASRDTYRDGHGNYDDRRSQKRRERPPHRGTTAGGAIPTNGSIGGPIPIWNSDANQLGGPIAGNMNYTSMNQMPSSGMVGARNANGGYRRGRCHQFDQKGFCSRGDTCPYEHISPNATIAVSDPIGYSPEHPGPINEGYDASGVSSHGMRGRGGVNARMGRGRGRGGRGGFDSTGMNASNANVRTILRVENISPEQCALDQVNDYFRRFGTIVNIQVDPVNRQALVQFSSNAEAYAAYSCQDAVFGNRFIKVFWHERLQNEHWQQGGTPTGSDAMETAPAAQSDADVKAQQRQAKLEQILDIQRKKEQLLQMQLEQQQLLEAQLNRSDLADSDRAELQQALEQITAVVKESQAETEHLRMQQQEAANNASLTYEQQRRNQLDRELESMQLNAKLNENGATSQNEEPESEEAMLRAKLAKLQKEAEELGIDASNSQDYSAGGYYGRGRGRGRGAYGGWRGRGRGRSSMTWTPATATTTAATATAAGTTNATPAPAAFKLDNRTTKIQVRDLTDDIKNTLQAHFSKFGVVTNINTLDAKNRAIITFETRHEAEKAAFSGAQMEGVGTLKMSWYNEPAPVVASTPETITSSISNTVMDEDGDFDAMEDSERSWKR
ncbi:hypothetical protein BDF22DRAFT_687200 [Syncephalis plumigaleata]|nr:hypothetical protein BDF22DRAFT_687200 [Syncephalis plumigaleata]